MSERSDFLSVLFWSIVLLLGMIGAFAVSMWAYFGNADVLRGIFWLMIAGGFRREFGRYTEKQLAATS